VAERESRVPGHAELVFCDQSIERALGWLSKCRAILVRYEKKAANYLGLIKMACVLLWYRRQHRLSVSG
jgi:transposase